MGGIIMLDAACGGQVCDLTVKNELGQHALLGRKLCLPGLQMTINGKRLFLSSVRAEMEITRQAPDFCRISTRAVLHDAAIVTQEYEIHEEGALFCNFAVDTPAGKSFDLSDCSMLFALDTSSAKLMRWGHYTRQPKYKRDYSTIHAFTEFKMHRMPKDVSEERELFPYVSASLGWKDTRFFSNHIEFMMEDWTSYNDGPLTQTKTRAGEEHGLWQAKWSFHDGRTAKIAGSYRYRNRWGIMFGRARNKAGADADPAVRNNALGSKICHCMYPYARSGETWPWVSMPIKQVAVQAPQFYKGNPDLARADEARRLGSDIFIIHQFWMRNPGSNNEPIADYQVNDPKWLHAFTDHCHELGMRVVYYVRGTEHWQHFSPFFEEYLQKDRDGMYSDWNSAFSMGYLKCSPLHASMHNYFHFTKAQRRRVGDGGILIGHTGNANSIASACFDAAIGGEFSVRHDELLASPESTAYYAHLACVGGKLISGNLPDRVAFSSPKAQAVCAAFGMMSHPFMEPNVTFDDRVAYIKPLWDSMNKLPGRVTQLHNPAYIPTRAVSMGTGNLYPSVFQSNRSKALVLVTNLGDKPESGDIELKLGELDVARKAKITPLKINGTHADVKVSGSAIRLSKVPGLQFSALLVG